MGWRVIRDLVVEVTRHDLQTGVESRKGGWEGRGLSKDNKASHRVQFQRSFGFRKDDDLSFPLLDHVAPLINAVDPLPRKCKYPQHLMEGKKEKELRKDRKGG